MLLDYATPVAAVVTVVLGWAATTNAVAIDPGVVASVGGTTLAGIIATTLVKGYAEYIRVSRKRELLIDAQLQDLRERADHRRRRSVHRKRQRMHWSTVEMFERASAGAAAPQTVHETPTTPITVRPDPPGDSHAPGDSAHTHPAV